MNTAKIVGIFDFYGMTLSIAEFESVRYVQLRPIVEVLGRSWKRAREIVLSGDNPELYGIKTLPILPLNTFLPNFLTHACVKTGALPPPKGGIPPHKCGENGETDTPAIKSHLCIRLDRVHLYLARMSTANMKAKGNISAANWLLKLQQEWAEVLHRYEAGEMVHKGKIQKDLIALVNAQAKTTNPAQKAAFTAMIDDVLAELGYLPPAKQAELFGGER